MKVLLVNKFYRAQGGAETVFFMTKALLEEAGHEVVPFAMRHDENVSTEWSDYFSRTRSYADGPMVARIRDSLSAIHSRDARRALRRLLRRFRPDVAHLHNVYHQLSLSVVDELQRARVPMVMSLHDYKIVCPSYALFTNGAPCVRCVQGSPWNAVRHRCVKNSFPGSIVAAIETTLARKLHRYGAIAKFIVPSEFLRALVLTGGVDPERVLTARYPVASDARFTLEPPSRPCFVYAGRFSPEKGLDVLLTASTVLRGRATVVLIGRGPLEKHLRERIASERLPVVIRDFISEPTALRQTLRNSTAMVVPSISYENAPMALLEAASLGIPSVASDIGGIPELVDDGVTGVLFPPGDARSLATALEGLAVDRELATSLGRNAWKRVRSAHDPQRYLHALLVGYAEVADRDLRRIPSAVGHGRPSRVSVAHRPE